MAGVHNYIKRMCVSISLISAMCRQKSEVDTDICHTHTHSVHFFLPIVRSIAGWHSYITSSALPCSCSLYHAFPYAQIYINWELKRILIICWVDINTWCTKQHNYTMCYQPGIQTINILAYRRNAVLQVRLGIAIFTVCKRGLLSHTHTAGHGDQGNEGSRLCVCNAYDNRANH